MYKVIQAGFGSSLKITLGLLYFWKRTLKSKKYFQLYTPVNSSDLEMRQVYAKSDFLIKGAEVKTIAKNSTLLTD